MLSYLMSLMALLYLNYIKQLYLIFGVKAEQFNFKARDHQYIGHHFFEPQHMFPAVVWDILDVSVV